MFNQYKPDNQGQSFDIQAHLGGLVRQKAEVRAQISALTAQYDEAVQVANQFEVDKKPYDSLESKPEREGRRPTPDNDSFYTYFPQNAAINKANRDAKWQLQSEHQRLKQNANELVYKIEQLRKNEQSILMEMQVLSSFVSQDGEQSNKAKP